MGDTAGVCVIGGGWEEERENERRGVRKKAQQRGLDGRVPTAGSGTER